MLVQRGLERATKSMGRRERVVVGGCLAIGVLGQRRHRQGHRASQNVHGNSRLRAGSYCVSADSIVGGQHLRRFLTWSDDAKMAMPLTGRDPLRGGSAMPAHALIKTLKLSAVCPLVLAVATTSGPSSPLLFRKAAAP